MKKILKSFLIFFVLFAMSYSFYVNTFAIEIEDVKSVAALTAAQKKTLRDLKNKENPTDDDLKTIETLEKEAGRKTMSATKLDGWDGKGEISAIESPTKSIMGTLINVIRIVGTGVAIIMITYVAIKYMSAAPSEKAEFKKSATAYIVGAVVLFAATNILKIISDFATTNI